MAKFVLAGYEGCVGFARLELLADTLAARLPHFNVNKVSSTGRTQDNVKGFTT